MTGPLYCTHCEPGDGSDFVVEVHVDQTRQYVVKRTAYPKHSEADWSDYEDDKFDRQVNDFLMRRRQDEVEWEDVDSYDSEYVDGEVEHEVTSVTCVRCGEEVEGWESGDFGDVIDYSDID